MIEVARPVRNGSDHERAQRRLGPFLQMTDLYVAARTMPRPLHDGDEAAVDPRVWAAHVCYARTRNPAVRSLLVDEYERYARAIAKRMHREAEPLNDLVQVAFEGLLLALERFEPERGVPFVGFATPTIVGCLKRHYRDSGWLLRVPRRVHELVAPARRASDDLWGELGRQPTSVEVAARLGVDVEDLLLAEEAAHARSTTSLSMPADPDEPGPLEPGVVDAGFARAENSMALQQALEELSEADRELLQLYYVEGRSQCEIAERLGVSQMQVSRLLDSDIRRLRSWLMGS